LLMLPSSARVGNPIIDMLHPPKTCLPIHPLPTYNLTSNQMSEAWAARAIDLLAQRGETLAVMEGSTGGLLSHLLTQVPGASRVFLGGVVAYGNQLKEQVGVPGKVLKAFGAVSEEAALAMAEAAQRWAGASIGLAVTGIAGPTGGSAAKPVGLTYVAAVGRGISLCRGQTLLGDRGQIKYESAVMAIRLLLELAEREEER